MAPEDTSRQVAANTPAPGTLPPFNYAKPTPPVAQATYAVPPSAPAQSGPWAGVDSQATDSGVRQVSHVVPQSKSDRVPRRTFNDVTASPCFGHAPDYSWLTGELQNLHMRNQNVWKVRYASAEEDDPYGGSVTLVDAGPMTEFKSGQMVRVEGQLVNPESRQPGPQYRVRSMHALTQP